GPGPSTLAASRGRAYREFGLGERSQDICLVPGAGGGAPALCSGGHPQRGAGRDGGSKGASPGRAYGQWRERLKHPAPPFAVLLLVPGAALFFSCGGQGASTITRSEEHTSELQS